MARSRFALAPPFWRNNLLRLRTVVPGGGCEGAGHSDGVMARMTPAGGGGSADRRGGVASARPSTTDVKRTAGDGDFLLLCPDSA